MHRGFASLSLCLIASVAFAASADQKLKAQNIDVTIDAASTSTPISPYLYGQFLEHIGPIVNHGLWAEMVDDRKFYGPILDREPPPETDPRRVWRGRTQSWIRLSEGAGASLDTQKPYVGEHALLLRPQDQAAVGVWQGSVPLLKGKQYEGHIFASGSPDAQINVSLVWGEGAKNRQTVSLPRLASDYTNFPLKFTSPVTTNEARLEIAATGNGEARVGVLSLMPADNIEGFRAEVINTLKQLNSGVYRFPGGNFVSAHEWRDAVGPRDKRAPTFDPVAKVAQPNDVGTDEFLTLSRLLNVEPYITVNAGFGDAWSAAQLVEYCNGAITTPMGKWRAENGHPEPYHVKYWGIGNEPWGDWQMGAMASTQYPWKNNEFAKRMRKVDPSIFLIAGGAMPKTMTTAKQSLRFGTSLIPEPLSPADWNGQLFQHSLGYFDELSEHFYAYAGTHFDLKQAAQVPDDPNEPLIDVMRKPANHVRATYEDYEDYLQRIPELKDKHITINIDEWAMIGVPPNSYKLVPAYAWAFHEMFRHSDLFRAAAYTFATAMLNSTRNTAELSPVGELFKLYREHHGTIPVKVIGNYPPPPPKYPPGGEQPKVNAGSDTYPVDVSAAWNEGHDTLSIAIVNPTESQQTVHLAIEGADLARKATLYRLAHPDVNYAVPVGQHSQVQVQRKSVANIGSALTLPPYSVSVYELRKQ
ncbi:MAG TPA: hypothetical protein VFS24_02645 [Steroidobacteraceae bacterium]|nr:hypothetical protein [Steroidobacteraceae bacterium]